MTSSPDADLKGWLTRLETLSPKEIDLGLDRVSKVLERLRPARPQRVIHVAGTNGKGSSVVMLETLFRARGDCVGAFTSPHIHVYNERVRVNGIPVSDTDLISAFEQVESARGETVLTYFEFGTLAALVVFESAGVETAILEVGMGGRLDAVNAVEPDAGIITNVSLDHCDWLGEDIESIAAEKAGIFRRGKPFIYGEADVPAAIRTAAETTGAEIRLFGQDFSYDRLSDPPDSWIWSGRRARVGPLDPPALAGAFQLRNASAVLALIEALDIAELLDSSVINAAFGRVELVGRCQLIERDGRWLFDVAHNPAAARVLSEFLADLAPSGRIVAIVGMLGDKDHEGIVLPLLDHVDTWIAVPARSKRAMPVGDLAALIAKLCDKPCLIADGLPQATRYARRRAGEHDLVLVTGSFYVVGPALELLGA